MVLELPNEQQVIVNDIMSKIPANPYVVEVIGKAIEIASKYPEDFQDKLELASQVASYVTRISEPMYYETYMVQAVLLTGTKEEEYAVLDTVTGTLTKTVKELTEFLETASWKTRFNIIYKVLRDNPKFGAVYFMILNFMAKDALKVTPDTDAFTLNIYSQLKLGLGYLEVCLRKTDLNILNEVYPYKNEFMSLVLDKLDF